MYLVSNAVANVLRCERNSGLHVRARAAACTCRCALARAYARTDDTHVPADRARRPARIGDDQRSRPPLRGPHAQPFAVFAALDVRSWFALLQWRIAQEGIYTILPFLSKRVVKIAAKDIARYGAG
jgi:hypothetical protein